MKFKISIITPNYNYGHFIGQTIQSVLDQNYSNYEHIIVDDGSTDNSVEVIREFVKKYPENIKLIQQQNTGQTPALNVALGKITGDIIGWINSDDIYYNVAFHKIVQTFNQFPGCDAVFGDIIIINERGEKIKYNRYLNFDYASGVFNGFGKIISSNAIFWKSYLTQEVGLLNEAYKIGMDSEYWSRLLFKREVKHISYPIACFRWHPEAKTIKRQDKSNQEFNYGLNENAEVFKKSYKNLIISKFVPVNYTFAIKYYYKMKRYFLRFLNGHYNSKI